MPDLIKFMLITDLAKFALIIDIFCILIICILLIGTIVQSDKNDKIVKYFRYMLYSTLVYLCFSLLANIFDGNPNVKVLTFIFDLFTFFSVDFIMISFSCYLYTILKNENSKYCSFLNVVVASCFISILSTIILAATKNLFIIDDAGCYVEQKLVIIPYLIAFFVMIELITIILINRKYFTKRQFLVTIAYELIPLIPIIIEILTNLYSLTSISITICILLVYVLIQNTTIEKSKLRASMLEEISNKDLLTGLHNRRSYYNRLSEIDKNKNVGLVFCDINGLKYTNDHFGHKAGDDLISKFSTLLTNTFGTTNTYRISGDEFVVIIPTDNFNMLLSLVSSFRSIMRINNNIAAIGFSYGKGEKIEHLVSEAEEKMYEDKRLNHRSSPWIDR